MSCRVPEIFVSKQGHKYTSKTFMQCRLTDRCSQNVAQFRYLGTTITDENLIQEDIKKRLNSGNACYNSVQKRSSSRLVSKNINVKVYKTVILPVVLYGCETWSLTLTHLHHLMSSGHTVLFAI
jgi:hypothetical protein